MLVWAGTWTTLSGQQETILTKYTFNSLFFNPAYAGSHGNGVGTGTVQYRRQWMGVEGAPTTMIASAEYGLKQHRLGLGVTIGREQIGINAHSELAISTSYKIRFENGGHLNGGIRTALHNTLSDFASLNQSDPGDPLYTQALESFSYVGVGLGIYYHDEVMYLGVSSPTVTTFGSQNLVPRRVNHLCLNAGLVIGDEYSSILWQPSILINYHQAVPLQITASVQAWFTDRFAVALHWRNEDALALSIELHFAEQWKISTAYDFTTSDLQQYSSGSPEVMLGYRIVGQDRRQYKEMRRWYY
jgi:type IX secretion system PorP/SprF family membrane protein